jgi:hypothetical protein
MFAFRRPAEDHASAVLGALAKWPFVVSFLVLRSGLVVAAEPTGAAREFAPGVRIQWSELTVEVGAEVVMRQGPLELLACSPNTKEHESILRVVARPTHIYQAMGLVGLTPGRPVRYDEKKSRWEPATGEGLDLRVRYLDEKGAVVVVRPEEWLAVAGGSETRSPAELSWTFAGSYTVPDGRFAADLEGTVVCLVDFEAALIAIPALHSADNEQLWLVAKTDAIPPKGTKCTLLIRAARRPPVNVELLPDGGIRHGERTIDAAALIEMLGPPSDDARPSRLRICRAAGTSEQTLETLVRQIEAALGYKGLIETQQTPCRFESPPAQGPATRD